MAGVSVDYVVCDMMKAGSRDLPRHFDTLALELGILHDHQNLDNFFTVLRHLTADDDLFLLNEFHPIQRTLFGQTGLRTPSPKTL